MSARAQLSGCSKRKLKRKREQEKVELKDSLKKYFIQPLQNAEHVNNPTISEYESVALANNSDLTASFADHDSGNSNLIMADLDASIPKSQKPGSMVHDTSRIEKFSTFETTAELELTISNSQKSENVIIESSSEKDVVLDPDPAKWHSNLSEQSIEYFLSHPPEQNMDLISKTERLMGDKNRSLSINSFYRIKQNKEAVNRTWLVLSPLTLSLYCWVCKLLSTVKSALTTTGLADWKHVNQRLSAHENSPHHRSAIIAMSLRLKPKQRLDYQLISEFHNETKYWREVLTRVVATVKFLSKRGLPFFGSDETLGSPHSGNFLGCLELLSEFDPFLANHLNKYGNCGTGRANYLSSTTINEFIDIMSQKVQNEIISEVKSAKYYSIITDSTPDISHLDQLCFVIRYVAKDNLPIERFLTFLPALTHHAEHLFQIIIGYIQSIDLDVLNCRGQSYDNASNMSGKYSGVQARLKEVNQYADYVPCAAHSLNLVGTNAVEANVTVVKFFCLVQELYNFFSASTHRWQILNNNIKENGSSACTLKSRSSTRWCADADATKALRKNYKCIYETLGELANNKDETAVTRKEAQSLHNSLNKLETIINTVVWDTVLQRLNAASKIIQKSSTNLCYLPDLFQSLTEFIQSVRDNFEDFEKEAKLILPSVTEYTSSRKKSIPRNKWLDDNNTPEVIFSPREAFIVSCHYSLCDNLILQLNRRKEPYTDIMKKFSCLINLKALSSKEEGKILLDSYPDDLSEDFLDELMQFKSIAKENESLMDMFVRLNEMNLSLAFPNMETALRIFLSIPISNCTGERSFSLLKRLKSPIRSSMDQNKLSALSILCMENDITNKLNYEDIISDFAEKKQRKKSIKI